MKKKSFLSYAPFIGAVSWFGYHCGAGFASGSQVKVYVAKYGAPAAFIVPIFAWICCAVFIGIIVEYARLVKAKSYRDVASSIYIDNPVVGKVVILVWDVMVFFSTIVASSSCVAGCGTLVESLFGLPYMIGCAAFVILMIALTCFGTGILDRLGKVSTPLIIMFIMVCVVGITRTWDNLVTVMTTSAGIPDPAPTMGTLLERGLTYGCIQISFVHAACVIGGGFKTRKESIVMVVIGFLMNAIAMVFGSLAALSTYPACLDSSMPLFDIVNSVPGGFGTVMMIVYNFVLVMAYITTAGGLIVGSHARYRLLLGKVIKNDRICNIIVVLIILGGASLLSVLGLEGVVDIAYGFLSKLRQPVWFFPLLILGPISIIRESKKQKNLASANPEA